MSDTPSASDPPARPLAELVLAVWDQVPEARLILDADWRYQYLNPAALELLGLDEGVVGRDSRLIHPDAPATPFGAAYRKVMVTREPEEVEHHYEPLDTFLRARILPVPDGGISIALMDVTDQRRPQVRLRRNLDLYQQVLDHTTQAISLRDPDSRFLLVNRAAAARIGCPAEEVVGRTPEEVFTPEVARVVRDIDQRVLMTGEPEDSPAAHALHPDRRVLAQVFPVRDSDGSIVSLGTSVTDLTALALAEAELAASQHRFRRVFGSTSLGILVMGGHGRILEANSALCRLLGYSRADLLKRTGLDLVGRDSPDLARRRSQLEAKAEEGYEIEEEFIRSDGRTVPVLLTVNAFEDPDGRGRLISVMVRDLTALRDMQAQLLAAERMEAVGRLAAGIAHDSNNILAAVSGYVELLGEQIDGDAAARRYLDGIVRSVQRAGEMVDRLMAFSSGQASAPTAVDLADLVCDLADMLRRLLPDDIDLQIETQPALTLADATQVRQVVLNLVVNARNALGAAGTIRISTRTGDDGSAVFLAVQDDGPGMTSEIARRCFEPFFSTRQSSGGTGLGLSTAQGIARQSGGELRVRTCPGAGSTFELELPAAEPQLGPGAGRALGGARVLVADDDAVVRDLMVSTLTSAGYLVTAAPDGHGALTALDDHDLVISDIDMPGLTGIELSARLAGERPELPVLLVSGAAVVPSGRPFLAKPFTRAGLLGAVEAALAATR